MSGRVAILCFTVFLGACRNLPEAYAPPEQRPLILVDRPYRVRRVISMDDSDAPSRFVRDISPALAGTWRWTGQRPAIDIFMRVNEGVRYVIDFALPEVTFKATGPVTVSFLVNDHLLDSVRYTEAGDKHFEKPVRRSGSRWAAIPPWARRSIKSGPPRTTAQSWASCWCG